MSRDVGTPAFVRRAVESIPLFAHEERLVIRPHSGVRSLNNSMWVVSKQDSQEHFAVRLVDPESSAHLGIDRHEESDAAHAAAAAGIAPEVVHYDATTGTMVTSWLASAHSPEPMDLQDPETLRALVETVRRMHGINKLRGEPGSVFRRIRHLVEDARRSGLDLPVGIGDAMRRLDELQQWRAESTVACGLNHNDLWENNILLTRGRLYLIDWEFAGLGDGLYDLATISMGGGFDARMDAFLIGEYGLAGPRAVADLESMKWVVRFFEAAWSLVMHGLKGCGKDAGFDYSGHSRHMFTAILDESVRVR